MNGEEPVRAERGSLEGEVAETSDSSQAQAGDEDMENPPEYESIDIGSQPPIDYETVAALKALEEESGSPPQDSFTAAAPPSYTQLFPKSEGGRRGGASRTGRRRHTLPRSRGESGRRAGSNRSIVEALKNRLQNMNKKTLGCVIVSVATVVVGIGVSMMVVGFINFGVCRSTSIPLYLVVAGFFLTFDLLYHLCLFFWERWHHSENGSRSTVYALRRCDCIAFFLFVWLLIGSNWIFRMGVVSSGCQPIDNGGVVVVSPTFSPNVTSTGSRVSRLDSVPRSSGDSGGCQDCSDSVYIFTVMVIMMQYVVGLALIVCCCSSLLRYRSR